MIRPRTARHEKRQRTKTALTHLLRTLPDGIEVFSTSPSPREIDSILKLQAACWDPSVWDTYAEIQALLSDPDWLVLLAKDTRKDSTIVGFCAGHLVGPELYLYVCEIHPDYRRQGLARCLTRALVYLGSLRQAKYCTTHAVNPHFERLAKEIGFESTGQMRQIHSFAGPELRAEIAKIL
jgi:RimJ/RimL family protein N-acetyltransferase